MRVATHRMIKKQNKLEKTREKMQTFYCPKICAECLGMKEKRKKFAL